MKILAAAVAASLAAAPAAHAAVITFSGLSGANNQPFTGSYVEDGYTVSYTGGDLWEAHLFGDAAPSLASWSVGAFDVSGGLFTLGNFRGAAAEPNEVAVYLVFGFYGGFQTFGGLVQTFGNQTFETLNAGTGNMVFDRVRFVVTGSGSFMSIDDITLHGVVPEPASWSLILGGFGMIGGAMRYRRRQAASFA